ncbi:zinc finger protein, putative [Ixodes scapularis]|uniref:Zinc finger protein, putative n=1 Tax=Ixodes scapularis TaxID=6945 RepID=B7QDM5_IXOSC|nr:zinc finger protein, putative [Ixodes scapularis]|eukprot:XP_002413639.1 zinc finger protein, putative [Ixodes scapularis]
MFTLLEDPVDPNVSPAIRARLLVAARVRQETKVFSRQLNTTVPDRALSQIEVHENLCEFLGCRCDGVGGVDPGRVPPEKPPRATQGTVTDSLWKVRRQKALHECRFCPYSCEHKLNLLKHERTHTGEKPFQCQSCLRGFATRANYVRHLKVHREGKFKCSFCEAMFTDKKCRTVHEQVHCGNAPRCNVCGRQFKSTLCLIQHKELQHEEPPSKETAPVAPGAGVVGNAEDTLELPKSLAELGKGGEGTPVKVENPAADVSTPPL